MDRNKLKDIASQSLVLLFLVHLPQIAGQDDHVFNTAVTISPQSTTKNTDVEFTCDFTLVGKNDLHLLYWETTNGDRLLTYNHKEGTTKIHSPYKEQLKIREKVDYNYTELAGTKQRIHTLRVKVDNCDRATYRCLILNQVEFTEGSDEKTLEIEANLPKPELCMKKEGAGECIISDRSTVYFENTTTVTVSCTVTESSVEPDITLTKDGVAENLTPDITALDGCLHNGVLQSGDIKVEKGEGVVFKCEANYGGTKESTEITVTFDKPQKTGFGEVTGADSANVGMIVGIVVGILILVAIVLVIVYVLKKQNKRRNQYIQQNQQKPPPAEKV